MKKFINYSPVQGFYVAIYRSPEGYDNLDDLAGFIEDAAKENPSVYSGDLQSAYNALMDGEFLDQVLSKLNCDEDELQALVEDAHHAIGMAIDQESHA